jgi:tetratricopeptide (TPR) repeat protein
MPRTRVLPALLLLLAILAPACSAQLGKNILIPAGSEVDRQMNAINASDPSQKLQLLDEFSKAHPDGDYQIVADEQYVNYYINAKQYDRAFEYGDKLFALDPDNFQNALNMVRAANEKGDTDKLFTYGEKAMSIVQRFKGSTAPAGTTADTWEQSKADKLASQKDNLDYIQQSLVSAAYNIKDPAKKANYFERIAKMYAGTPEATQALTMAAFSYQQAQERAKMQAAANAVLAKDPDNIGMLLLLADDYSEKNEQLDKAESYAKKASTLADSAKKPESVTEVQWKEENSVQKGLALSALGQINLEKKLNVQAVDYLTKAAPLLKSNAASYARNQYRLGFAYVNLKKNPEAKQAFTDAASVDSPYKGPAQKKLSELGNAKPAANKKTS